MHDWQISKFQLLGDRVTMRPSTTHEPDALSLADHRQISAMFRITNRIRMHPLPRGIGFRLKSMVTVPAG